MNIDVVSIFENKATLKEWRFVYGAKGFHNFELQQQELGMHEIVLIMFPASVTPVIENGMWSRYRVNTQLWLCRKFEEDYTSSIKETEMQKYKIRLKELSMHLDNFLKEMLQCSPNINATNIRYFRELNQLSASIDGVTADITFEIWE